MVRNYKRPVSVLVVVYARSGEVLLVRRSRPVDFWQSVTGSLKWDETPARAVCRELREETGLEAGAGLVDTGRVNRYGILPAWRVRYGPDVTHNIEHVFRLFLDQPRAIRLNPAEHTEYRWLARGQAAERASSSTDRAAILALPPDQ